MTAPRVLQPAELAWAMRLAKQNISWHRISRSLGRPSGKILRDLLDPKYRDLCGACPETTRKAQRGFTRAELALARRLAEDGKTWHHIGRLLGRASGKGIRCQLDPEYRERYNSWHANYKRNFRPSRARPRPEPRT